MFFHSSVVAENQTIQSTTIEKTIKAVRSVSSLPEALVERGVKPEDKPLDLGDIFPDVDELIRRAVEKVEVYRKLYPIFHKELDDNGLMKLFDEIEMPFIKGFFDFSMSFKAFSISSLV